MLHKHLQPSSTENFYNQHSFMFIMYFSILLSKTCKDWRDWGHRMSGHVAQQLRQPLLYAHCGHRSPHQCVLRLVSQNSHTTLLKQKRNHNHSNSPSTQKCALLIVTSLWCLKYQTHIINQSWSFLDIQILKYKVITNTYCWFHFYSKTVLWKTD